MSEHISGRRKFLTVALGAGAAAALGLAANAGRKTAVDSQPSVAPQDLQTFTRTSWALGTDIALTVLHSDREVAERALNAAFIELNQVEDVLSIYRPNSQISRLNRTGRLDRPHNHFLKVFNASQEMARTSNGAFDATVESLWELYSDAKKKNDLPTPTELEIARAKVDFKKIQSSSAGIEFTAPGMKITFNGIAQGYAADCVLAVLKSQGIQHALIDTGEMASEGHKADGSAFRVGIQHPRKQDEFIGICAMDGRALATSGDYATYFTDDFLYHHIFDPATGRSPLELASASILAPTGMTADALTKPVFVLGAEKGMALIESLPGCDAFLVTKSGKQYRSKGFPLV